MISAEAPILFSKACELFIKDITYRALYYTSTGKRKTLQKSDIASAIRENDMFDFLIDVIPREEVSKDYMSKRELEGSSLASNYQGSFNVVQRNAPQLPDHNLMKNPLLAKSNTNISNKIVMANSEVGKGSYLYSDHHGLDRDFDMSEMSANKYKL
jgi:hypothetical protein